MKQKTLSEKKKKTNNEWNTIYLGSDVKQFIKEILEEIDNDFDNDFDKNHIFEIIKQKAGDELI